MVDGNANKSSCVADEIDDKSGLREPAWGLEVSVSCVLATSRPAHLALSATPAGFPPVSSVLPPP